jgi:hypothetical protein
VTGLQFEFASLDWGRLTPGRDKTLTAAAAGAAPAAKPMVLNSNATVSYIVIEFSPLVGNQTRKAITEYSVSFKGETASAEAGEPVCLSTPLMPREKAPIDLVVRPPAGFPEDRYTGSITIIAASKPGLGKGRCG